MLLGKEDDNNINLSLFANSYVSVKGLLLLGQLTSPMLLKVHSEFST